MKKSIRMTNDAAEVSDQKEINNNKKETPDVWKSLKGFEQWIPQSRQEGRGPLLQQHV